MLHARKFRAFCPNSLRAGDERVGRYLERQGLLVRDMENSYLTLESRDDTAMDDLLGHSVTYRIAVGPHQGEKAFTLQTLAPRGEDTEDDRLAKAAGFSLHCGVAAAAHQRDKLERLCRYIARPVIASIEDPAVINRILEHLARRDAGLLRQRTPAPRAPPQRRLPGLTD